MRDRDITIIRRIAIAIILVTTAVPIGIRSPRIQHPQWKLFPVDLVLNVLLYVPFGFGISNGNLRIAAGKGVILSFLIEALQTFCRGRSAMIMDVVANTAGAGIGALLFQFGQRRGFPQREAAGNDPRKI